MLVLYSLTSIGQVAHKLLPPRAKAGRMHALFTIVADSVPHEAINSERVLHLYYDNNKVASFHAVLHSDSISTTLSSLDSLVFDSVMYDSILAHPLLTKRKEYRLTMVDASHLAIDFPIEGVLAGNVSVSDTVSTKKDSTGIGFAKKIPPFSIHGSVKLVAQASNNKYLYQGLPQNYLRTYVNTEIDCFGLPFSAGYMYTTESNSGINQLNNYRISFQYDKFYEGISQRLSEKIKTDGKINLPAKAGVDINEITPELLSLNKQVSTDEFKLRYEKNRQIIQLGEKDSLFRESHKYKKAIRQQELNDKKLTRLKELTILKEKFLNEDRLADINVSARQKKLSSPRAFRRAAKKYKLVSPVQSLFLSVKRLDIGTFDPQYSTLTLNGINLTGFNIEVNPGYFYAAAAWGKVIAGFDNPLSFFKTPAQRSISAIRTGIGRKERLLVSVSLLKGKDESGNAIKDSFFDYYLPSDNYVTGLDATYRFAGNGEVSVEYARSQNNYQSLNTSQISTIKELATSKQDKYAGAWNAYTRFTLNGGNTRIKLSSRLIDPFFYSFGTPYLRKDNFRVELKGEQLFWKKQLTTALTLRSDRDNLYGTKAGTSRVYSTVFNVQLRIKKLPYLIVTYSPNYQFFYNSAIKRSVSTRSVFYNIISGYTHQTKKTTSNITLGYCNQFNVSSEAEWQSYNARQFSAFLTVASRRSGLSVNSGVTYVLPENKSDTAEILVVSSTVSRPLFKNRINASAGLAYHKDFDIQERVIADASASFTLPWRLVCQLTIEKHFIHSYRPDLPAKDALTARLSIIKTF